MEENKKIRRPPEVRAEEISEKIEKLELALIELDERRANAMRIFDEKEARVKEKIMVLQQKKEHILSPRSLKKTRISKKQKIAEILKRANRSGLKPEEIADRLGVDLPGYF